MLKWVFRASAHVIVRHGLRALLFSAVLLHGRMAVAETSIVVVTNKDSQVNELSREEVAALFLGKRKFIGETPVTPIDTKDSALRERFYLAVADMNGMRVKAYWSRIVFSGQGRPPQEVSIREARARLTSDRAALTYLPVDQVTPDMKIVFRVP